MTKTKKDVLLAQLEMLVEATNNPFALSEFKQRVLPILAGSKSLHDPISQDHYDSLVAAYRKDLPMIIVELRKVKIGAPPHLEPRN